MRLLVLGGTRFVGRAVVAEGLTRGDEVTTLNRGARGEPPPGVRALHADRTDPDALVRALGEQTWDAVVDTWSHAPTAVQTATRLLRDRTDHYGYVSSRSVYRWPIPSGVDESAAVVDGDPSAESVGDYAADKRGGELAVLDSFPDRSLLARAGLILGPHEDVGRLPWWLRQVAGGGRVAAPGPVDRPLQHIDARDLAAWMLDAAARGVTGAFNAVSRPGHSTIGELLGACVDVVGADAELVWLSPDELAAAGVTGWTDLPVWVPPTGELAALHDGDVSAAYAAGLRCRPVRETVEATWRWLQDDGAATTSGTTRAPVGPSPEVAAALERAVSARTEDGRAGGRG